MKNSTLDDHIQKHSMDARRTTHLTLRLDETGQLNDEITSPEAAAGALLALIPGRFYLVHWIIIRSSTDSGLAIQESVSDDSTPQASLSVASST